MYLLSVLSIILCFGLLYLETPFGMYGFIDVMSILFLVVLVFPIMFSAGLLGDLNNGIRLVLGKRKEAGMLELKRAKLAVGMMMKVSVCSSVFVTMIELVVILHNMNDPAYLGPMISTALLTVLYAVVISLLLLPVCAKLEQRILEYMPSETEGTEGEKEVIS